MTNPARDHRISLPAFPIASLDPGARSVRAAVRRLVVVDCCIGKGVLGDPVRRALYFFTLAGQPVAFYDTLEREPSSSNQEVAELRRRVVELELERQELEVALENGPDKQPGGPLAARVWHVAGLARQAADGAPEDVEAAPPEDAPYPPGPLWHAQETRRRARGDEWKCTCGAWNPIGIRVCVGCAAQLPPFKVLDPDAEFAAADRDSFAARSEALEVQLAGLQGELAGLEVTLAEAREGCVQRARQIEAQAETINGLRRELAGVRAPSTTPGHPTEQPIEGTTRS